MLPEPAWWVVKGWNFNFSSVNCTFQICQGNVEWILYVDIHGYGHAYAARKNISIVRWEFRLRFHARCRLKWSYCRHRRFSLTSVGRQSVPVVLRNLSSGCRSRPRRGSGIPKDTQRSPPPSASPSHTHARTHTNKRELFYPSIRSLLHVLGTDCSSEPIPSWESRSPSLSFPPFALCTRSALSPQNRAGIIHFLKVKCNVGCCLPRHARVWPADFFFFFFCQCESKAKFPILEALAYFISRLHPHYSGRRRSLRIPLLWCVCSMRFKSQRRAEECSASKQRSLLRQHPHEVETLYRDPCCCCIIQRV